MINPAVTEPVVQFTLYLKVNYFQVIFTLPDRLPGLILGNRRALDLLADEPN